MRRGLETTRADGERGAGRGAEEEQGSPGRHAPRWMRWLVAAALPVFAAAAVVGVPAADTSPAPRPGVTTSSSAPPSCD